MTFKVWFYDTIERAGSTLVQAAIVYVLAATAIDEEFWRGLVVALVVAGVNVLKAALTTWIPEPQIWWQDALVRTVWTFLITLLGSLASVNWFDLINLGFWRQVLVAALTAAAAVLKAVYAKYRTPIVIHPELGQPAPESITPASLVALSKAA